MSPTQFAPRPNARIGPIELSVIASMLFILTQVTWPQLRQVRLRAEQAEAVDELNKVATAARAHFIQQGTYACGQCDASVSTGSPYTYSLGLAPPPPGEPCAQLSAAQGIQSAQAFVATAVRVLPGRSCELWQVGANSAVVRKVVALPNVSRR